MSNPNDPYDPKFPSRETPFPADDFGRLVNSPAPVPRGALRGAAEADPVQPIGALQSGTIKTLIVGLIVVLAAFGVKLKWSDAQVQAVADGVIAFTTVVSTVGGILFRIRATRKVEVGAKATDKSATVATILALLGSLTVYGAAGGFTGGCQQMFPATSTPASRVYALKYAWTQAQREAKEAIDARMLDNRPDVLRAIPAARQTVDDALATALRFAQDPAKKADALFWIEAADRALQHFVELTGTANRSLPTTRPATRPAANPIPDDALRPAA